MALIKCSECGQVMTDQATKCPRCGNPVNDGATHYDNQGGGTVYRNGGNRENKYINKNNNNNWLYGIIAFLVAALIGGGLYFYNKYQQSESNTDEQQVEQRETEPIKEKEQLEKEKVKKGEDVGQEVDKEENEKGEDVGQKEEKNEKNDEVARQQMDEIVMRTTVAPQFYGRVSDPDGYTNIRRGPSTNYDILRSYNSGDYLYYTPQKDGWSMVYSGNSASTFMGYMHTSRIVKVDVGKGSSSSSVKYHKGFLIDPKDTYVNIRKGPGMNYPIAKPLDTYTTIYYTTTTGSKWYKVYDTNYNYQGYVYYDRIKNSD